MNIESFNLKKCNQCKGSSRIYLTLNHIEYKHLEEQEPFGKAAKDFKRMLDLSEELCSYEEKAQNRRWKDIRVALE